MNENSNDSPGRAYGNGSMFARFGDGHWYAILPSMAETLRKNGAVVSVLPDGPHVEEVQNSFRCQK